MSATNASLPKGPVSQHLSASAYLREKRVPQLFESLLAGLMMECPDDHMTYLEEKLDLIKEIGIEHVEWDVLVAHLHPTRNEQRKKLVDDSEQIRSKKGCKHVSDSKLYPVPESPSEITNPHIFKLTNPVDISVAKKS